MCELKKCSDCKESKQLDEFYNLKSAKDGKQGRCKKCSYIINKKIKDKKRALTPPKPEPILSEILKECRACGNIKSIDLFYNNSKEIDGKFIKCKHCVDNKIAVPIIPIIVDGKRVCSKCNNLKDIELFSKSSKEKSGYRSCCKKCIKEQDRINKVSEKRQGYRDANKDRTYVYNKKYYNENKSRFIKILC